MRRGTLCILVVAVGVLLMFVGSWATPPGSKMSVFYPESEHLQPYTEYKCTDKPCTWNGSIEEMEQGVAPYGQEVVGWYCPHCGAYIGWTNKTG